MAGLSKREKDELPGTLERSPEHAQETFVRTKESAEETYDGDGGAASRVAWSSVKHSYEKVGDRWEAKGHKGPSDAQSARPSGAAKRDRPVATAGGVDASATKGHLLDVARRLDVRGRSRMTKAELVHAIDAANVKATRQAR